MTSKQASKHVAGQGAARGAARAALAMVAMAAGLGAGASPARATQLLSLGPEINNVDECGIYLPVNALRVELREYLLDSAPGGSNIDVWVGWEPGGDDTTSEDDTLVLNGSVYAAGFILVAGVEAKVTFIPGQTDRNPDLAELSAEYGCAGQDPPESFPTFFVRRMFYQELDEEWCAGDNCSEEGSKAEEARCTLQGMLQEKTASISDGLARAYVIIDNSLSNIFPGDPRFRTTIFETQGEPHHFVWRVPDILWHGSRLVDQVRASILASGDEATESGVHLRCDHGHDCEDDADGDGWCDAEDCCPDQFNVENDSCGDSDGDGLPDSCDKCPLSANPDQIDLDWDSIGDACDDDKDGDGVHNGADCDEHNPELRTDIDGDNVCDKLHVEDTPEGFEQHRTSCEAACQQVFDRQAALRPEDSAWLNQWAFYKNGCLVRCNRARDNCVDGRDDTFALPECGAVHADAVTGHLPAPSDLLTCEDRFANPLQEDADGSGVGDRCETGVLGLTFEPGPVVVDSDAGPLMCAPEHYLVEFRANAASATADERFIDTSVESCACTDQSVGYGYDWPESCTQPNLPCDKFARDKWNPIRDVSFANPTSSGPYPVPAVIDASKAAFLGGYWMGRDREVSFRRSEAANQHTFHWDYKSTMRFPVPFNAQTAWANVQPETLVGTFDAPLPLKVRVAHSDFVVQDEERFSEGQVALSGSTQVIEPPSLCSVMPYVPELWNRFTWFDPCPYRARVPGWVVNPGAVAWGVATEPGQPATLVTFGRSLARPSSLKAVQVRPGADLDLDLTALRTTTGRLHYSLVGGGNASGPAVFAYGASVPGAPAVLWIGLLEGETSEWMTAAQVFGSVQAAPMPSLQDGAPVFDEASQRLFVLGHEWVIPSSPSAGPHLERNVLISLDLASGQWERWGRVEALGETEGASVTFDPSKRRLLVYGGKAGEATLDRLVEVRLDPFSAKVLADCSLDSDCAGRSSHGATYDPVGHVLYVYGGERDGEALAGGAAFDLFSATWSPLPMSDTGGPGARTRPVVAFDLSQGALWVAGGIAGETTPAPWQLLLASGAWLERPSLRAAPAGQAVSPSEPLVHRGAVEGSVAFPGEVRLIEALSEEPNLELRVSDELGRPLAADTEPGAQHQLVLFGQPGQGYLAKVSTGPGYPGSQPVAVTFSDREAFLEPAGSLAGLPGVTSVVAERGLAFVGHATGVSVVDLADPEQPQVLADLETGGLVQEVASCGPGRLCVAQTWGQGDLVVIDVADPRAPFIAASMSLPGLCRSLGVRLGTAYVGCGAAGIHVVALDAPSGPVKVDTFWPGSPVSEVKVTDRLLVAGLFGKRVRVYRLGGTSGPALLAEKRTSHHPVQVRVFGTAIHVSEAKGLPWALCVAGVHCGVGQEVGVLELDEQAGSLDVTGSYAGALGAVPYAASWRNLVVVPDESGVEVLRAEALP